MKRILIVVSWIILALSHGAVFADSASDQMANVQAIMAQAHQQEAQQQAQQQTQIQQNQQAAQASSGFFHSLFKEMSSSPKQQMTTQNQAPAAETYYSSSPPAPVAPAPLPVATVDANGLFQNATNQRLDALEQSEAGVQAKMAQFAEAISMINEQEVQLNQQVQQMSKQLSPAFNAGVDKSAAATSSILNAVQGDTHAKKTQYVLYVILLLLVIIILLMLMPRRSAFRLETVASSSESVVADYDVMASEEGVSTKLDLARAYIAMEDYQAASHILAEVKKMGNKQQRVDADKMSRDIPTGR